MQIGLPICALFTAAQIDMAGSDELRMAWQLLFLNWTCFVDMDDDEREEINAAPAKEKQTRNCEPRPDYDQSVWARFLRRAGVAEPRHKNGKLFRTRFRTPYPVFRDIYETRHFPIRYYECKYEILLYYLRYNTIF